MVVQFRGAINLAFVPVWQLQDAQVPSANPAAEGEAAGNDPGGGEPLEPPHLLRRGSFSFRLTQLLASTTHFPTQVIFTLLTDLTKNNQSQQLPNREVI